MQSQMVVMCSSSSGAAMILPNLCPGIRYPSSY